MTSAFVGEAQSKGDGDPEDLFQVDEIVAGDKTAPPVADTGCTLQWPAYAGRRCRRNSATTQRPLPARGRELLRRVTSDRCRDDPALVFNVTNGLIIGAFYVLMALGLSLILNLSNVINFAHGGFLVIGGYIAYTITPYVGFWGALLIAPPLTARHRSPGRARADPPALWARSALQPAADLRPRLHHRGRHALHLGRAGQARNRSGYSRTAVERRVLLHHRLSPVHGRDGGGRGCAAVRAAALHAARHPHPCRHARSRDGFRPGHQRADAALAELRGRHFPRRAERRAGGRTARA